jgi:hypothetical protein
MHLRLPEVDGSQQGLVTQKGTLRYQELRLMPNTLQFQARKRIRTPPNFVRRESGLMTASANTARNWPRMLVVQPPKIIASYRASANASTCIRGSLAEKRSTFDVVKTRRRPLAVFRAAAILASRSVGSGPGPARVNVGAAIGKRILRKFIRP